MALVISRKKNQTIVIETQQGQVVLRFNARVKVSIEAAKEIHVRRGELEKAA